VGFGRNETQKLNALFDHFNRFDHMKKKLKTVGTPSANGFLLEIQFKRMSYVLCALLKFSKQQKADNLYYEAYVGLKYVNRQMNYFPCFTETYGIYRVQKGLYQYLRNPDTEHFVSPVQMNQNMTKMKLNPDSMLMSVTHPTQLSVLIAYFANPIPFVNYVQTFSSNKYFVEFELPTLLYQIYKPLSVLMYEFTHNDLHQKNVLLYKLPNNGCFRMNFINSDGSQFSFLTNHVVKIIDYGRAFFYASDTDNSPRYLEELKALLFTKFHPPFRDHMLTRYGYMYWGNTENDPFHDPVKNYFVDTQNGNISIDLRAARNCWQYIKPNKFTFPICSLLSRVSYETTYGTPGKQTDLKDNRIRNVHDMAVQLEQLFVANAATHRTRIEDRYSVGFTFLGTMNIFTDRSRDIQFVAAPVADRQPDLTSFSSPDSDTSLYSQAETVRLTLDDFSSISEFSEQRFAKYVKLIRALVLYFNQQYAFIASMLQCFVQSCSLFVYLLSRHKDDFGDADDWPMALIVALYCSNTTSSMDPASDNRVKFDQWLEIFYQQIPKLSQLTTHGSIAQVCDTFKEVLSTVHVVSILDFMTETQQNLLWKKTSLIANMSNIRAYVDPENAANLLTNTT